MSDTEDRRATYVLEDGIGVITLADPGRRNSITSVMSRQVAEICAQLSTDSSVRVVLLCAEGPTFSAGGDINALLERKDPLTTAYLGFDALTRIGVPTLAVVQGPAVGAGLNWALACDVIIAGTSARFDPRFLSVGIHPGGAQLWKLSQLMGAQATAASVIFGESISAEKAEQLGLIWKAVPDAELQAYARSMAAVVAGRSPELVKRTKASLGASQAITTRRIAVDLELVAQEWSMGRPAFLEGVEKLRQQVKGDR